MHLSRRTLVTSAVSSAAIAAAAPALARSSTVSTSVLDTHDAIGLASLVRSGKISALELLELAIRRAEAVNPRFNFMAQKHYDYARRQISKGLPKGAFTGVPWLLKDLNTYIAGELTENGSRFFKGYRATVTSELVKRVERAGFVIFGKTTTPEYGLTVTTEGKLTGNTRNPWNPDYSSGGSSGGAAAAVAAGVLPAAHATDGGGSIRAPASCCGLFGLKPSRGRIPMGPLRTEGWGGMSTHHAVSWSVRDSAALMDATHGPEPGSRYTAPSPVGTFLSHVGKNPGKLRIALMLTPFSGTPVDPEVREATRAAAKLCESLGHRVDEATPKFDYEPLAFGGIAMIAASVAADIEDRAKATGITPGPDILEDITLAIFDIGKTITGREFARINHAYQTAAVAIARFMEKYDVILSPTLAEPPKKIGEISLSPGVDFNTWAERLSSYAGFTGIFNGTGQPSMSVPLAMSKNGLPIGMMFTGRYGEEALLFRLAGQLEQAAPWMNRRPKL